MSLPTAYTLVLKYSRAPVNRTLTELYVKPVRYGWADASTVSLSIRGACRSRPTRTRLINNLTAEPRRYREPRRHFGFLPAAPAAVRSSTNLLPSSCRHEPRLSEETSSWRSISHYSVVVQSEDSISARAHISQHSRVIRSGCSDEISETDSPGLGTRKTS